MKGVVFDRVLIIYMPSAGEDYVNETISYTWESTEAERCYPVRPINDTITEADEQFHLILFTSEPCVIVASSFSTITIEDNDSK